MQMRWKTPSHCPRPVRLCYCWYCSLIALTSLTLFAVLQNLSVHSINASAAQFRRTATTLINEKGLVDASHIKPIDAILHPIFAEPSSPHAGTSVAHLWATLPTLAVSIDTLLFDIAIKRQDYILLNLAAWKWLDVVCSDNCWSYLLNPGPADNWIKQLTDKIGHLLDARKLKFTVNSSDYLVDLPSQSFEWSRSANA